MKVFVLGLDGATWDLLRPLADRGDLPTLARLMAAGASGTLNSIFPPLSPVAWTGIMTGKNSGKHGVFEFLEYATTRSAAGSTRRGRSRPTWSGRSPAATGKTDRRRRRADELPARGPPPGSSSATSSARPMRPTSASDPAIFDELQRRTSGPYRPWSTAVHDGGNEAGALKDLTEFLDHHLKAVQFLMSAGAPGTSSCST